MKGLVVFALVMGIVNFLLLVVVLILMTKQGDSLWNMYVMLDRIQFRVGA